ncbi:GSCOCG00002840001-RA-CDS [Cotesia congregata]|nr:GSCOCG00002840001-RA-CDS [Cotesia congregata]
MEEIRRTVYAVSCHKHQSRRHPCPCEPCERGRTC